MPKTTLSVKPTRRQYEAMTMFALGFQAKEIAMELGLTPKTVRNHIETSANRFRIYKGNKVGMRSLCLSQNWIEYRIKPYEEIEPIWIDDLIRRNF